MGNNFIFLIADFFPLVPLVYLIYKKQYRSLSAQLVVAYIFLLLLQPLLLRIFDWDLSAAASAKYLVYAGIVVVLTVFFIIEIRQVFVRLVIGASGFLLFLLMLGSAFQMNFSVQPFRLLNYGLFGVSFFSIVYLFIRYKGELMYRHPVFWMSAGLMLFYGSIMLTYLFYRYIGHHALVGSGFLYFVPFALHCVLVSVAAYISSKKLPGPKNANRF